MKTRVCECAFIFYLFVVALITLWADIFSPNFILPSKTPFILAVILQCTTTISRFSFQKILSGLLVCPPSQRNSPSKRSSGNGRLEADVRDCFVDIWFSDHDDVRWFFLREAVYVYADASALISPMLNTSLPSNPYARANLLSILGRLNTFPTEQVKLTHDGSLNWDPNQNVRQTENPILMARMT